ncbi:MAG: aspartyl-tRNA(Asn)/glutamyl-tRNA(Gln) amidotransferase subunit A [Patiriisocius sp.]
MKNYTNLTEVQQNIKDGNINLPNIVESYLQKIKSSKLNAFLEIFEEDVLSQAKLVQDKIMNNTAGKLAGMVLGIKDNMSYNGHKVSASSKILEGFESIYNATAIQRLLDEDVIIIGRLNCDEFAMGSSNENSAFGAVAHPLDADYVPGGSSGGSAVAVAADLCMASLGSDTGGSIRQPASLCNVIGLKPTYGRISRYGLLAYASSFDQIGTFTKNTEDAARLLEVMSGADDYDSTVSFKGVDDYRPKKSDVKYTISYIKEAVEHEGNDPEIVAAMKSRLEKLENAGHTVKAVSFPYLKYMVPAYYVLTTAEASSNLARYDGIRFGYRSGQSQDIESTYVKSRSEGFGKEVQRRIMLGAFVLSSGYYDAYYAKAQKVRRLIKTETSKILQKSDFILLPTTPTTAFKKDGIKDPIKMYLQDIFTVHANLAGMPAISLPLDQHSNGFGFGTQLIANQFDEKKLLNFSEELMNNF